MELLAWIDLEGDTRYSTVNEDTLLISQKQIERRLGRQPMYSPEGNEKPYYKFTESELIKFLKECTK